MKVTFVTIGAESLGIEYLSASLKKAGHKVELVFDPGLFDDKYYFNIPFLGNIFNYRKKLIKKVLNSKPDIIAFSVFTDTYNWAIDVAKELKSKTDVPIMMGGIHITSVPDKVIKNPYIDILALAECEEAIVELCDKMEKNEDITNIENFWVKKDGKWHKNEIRSANMDLDTIEFPDKELFADDVRIKDCYMILTSRGCPFRCTYCSNAFLLDIYKNKGSYLRRRGVDNVIEELKQAKKKFNYKVVSFMDDIFTSDVKWLNEFLERYKKEIDIPFRAISHPLYFNTDIAKKLKKAGCYRVELGLQSTDEEYRKKILKRYETNDQVIKAFKACEEAGLSLMVDHIFGLPQEKEEHLLSAAKFYSDYNIDRIACFWLSYFPKTEIIEIAKNMGEIDDSRIEGINNAKEKMYHDGGSVINKKREKMIKDYDLLFKLIPVLPKSTIKKIIKNKWYKKFHHTPFFIPMGLEVVMAIKNKDYETLNYIKHYSHHFKKRIFQK
jgi:radical SAM superfamily enzyme YgiQ (UPF0313 family)